MSDLKRDPDSIEKILFFCRPFLKYFFRVEVSGLQDLPNEPFVFIANHNIGAAVEIAALLDAWQRTFRERPIYGLTHPFAFRVPGFRTLVSKCGTIPATYSSAYIALDSGASLLIFPGGNWEAVRPFSQRNLCDLGEHYGWARIALKAKRRVVPISISGSHAVNPVLLRSRWLTLILVIPKLLGLKYFPVSVSQIFWGAFFFFATKDIAPLWLCLALTFLGFVLTPLFAIWPSKIRIRIGKPIDLQELTAHAASEREKSDEEILKIVYARDSQEIQTGMNQKPIS